MHPNLKLTSLLSTKIPTLLGLGVLVAGLTTGVILVSTNQIFQSQASPTFEPLGVEVSNISDTQATISWSTQSPISGFIKASKESSLDQSYKDDRDESAPENHQSHFVTIRNLTPKTTYYFKIQSGTTLYPSTDPLTFTTAAEVLTQNLLPIIGQVLTPDYLPADDVILLLNIPGGQKLASITKSGGSFILPLAQLLTEDLSTNFLLSETQTIAELFIVSPSGKSKVELELPLSDSEIPPIVIGQDQILASDESTATPTPTPKLDVNDDGVINSVDRIISQQNAGKSTKK
ncbi:MAG: fibronectin type III domain-containing protein [Candidatus Daviesbacteria bacterium]|nr:fibronectin type III domain-containing protein [Candidatus Daviesbacteria bacterium]